jgi:SAM-dependent MidA family methyltransferase
MDTQLPDPSEEAKAASLALADVIAHEIGRADGWISFARYMELALHYPGLGYYGGGSRKFGDAGDFVTAPELSPLFGRSLAAQVGQIMALSAPEVLEVGAGSGRLAADLLLSLAATGQLPSRYLILELSGELRARQQMLLAETVPQFVDRVHWLEQLPELFSGCVVANELLDAMPVHALAWTNSGLAERGVVCTDAGFAWADRPASAALVQASAELPVAVPFVSEVGLAARAWVAEWGRRLESGALLLIDYGLPRHEFYHPQRNRGTLRCHYRHASHDNPFWWPGLSDITAHVDFTAVAEAGYGAGLLINCGLGEHLAARRLEAGATSLRATGAVQTLISPQEMGELFKVIALGRSIAEPLTGFVIGDRSHSL